MPLAPGTKLGPYEIQSLIGKGGMGEVYRAHDPNLNRDVAIKILPAALANDADYLTRFQREAQTLASLNHPNIASIYGLESQAIVMELVEGETLKGPLPIEDALPIAKQIAEALEAAHDKGIIHRDLKPANVKLTPEGVVKVLDFGLAKATERTSTAGADSPTLTMRATEAGLILGTAGYMSPEQAAGKSVDRRADIWAFGVVLYELITGTRLFDGETVSHTLADVLRADIDLNKIPAGPIRDLVKRCLDRNLKSRLQHIGEARIAIENMGAAPTAPSPATPTKPNLWPWAVAAVACLIAGVLAATRVSPEPPTPMTFEVNAPPGVHFAPIGITGGSAISPDGKWIAFAGENNKQESQLYIRATDSIDARPLTESTGAGRPFWSPDSKSLAFVAGQKLKRIDIAGGSPITLCDASQARGGDWNADGVILFAQQRTGIQRISASGGTPTPVTALDEKSQEASHYYPQFLPGGRRFLYLLISGDVAQSGIVAATLDGKRLGRIVQTGFRGHYDAGSGRLLYVQGEGSLMARRMALEPLDLTGEPSIVANGLRGIANNGYAEFSLSTTGDLFYARAGYGDKRQFTWRDRSGKQLEQPGPTVDTLHSRLSPDGTRVAYIAIQSGVPPEVWVLDLLRGLNTRITFGGVSNNGVVWSQDGKYLYFGTNEGLRRKASDGSGAEELILRGRNAQTVGAVTPDGKFLITRSFGYWKVPLTGDAKPEEYQKIKHLESQYAFSPDGRWLAYMSNESGVPHIFVRGFPEERGKWQISSDPGNFPHWRRDGKELYWSSGSETASRVMAAGIDLQRDTVRVGKPETLFQFDGRSFVGNSADGRRFLLMENKTGPVNELPMVVVRNWAAKLAK